MQPPVLHFSQMSDELGEPATLGVQHAPQAFQQLRIGEMFELPELVTVSHDAAYNAVFRAPQWARWLAIA